MHPLKKDKIMSDKTNMYAENRVSIVETDNYPSLPTDNTLILRHLPTLPHVPDNQLVTSALIKRDYSFHRNSQIAVVLNIDTKSSEPRYFFINSINFLFEYP